MNDLNNLILRYVQEYSDLSRLLDYNRRRHNEGLIPYEVVAFNEACLAVARRFLQIAAEEGIEVTSDVAI